MTEYNFKGHDYTELFPYLGITCDDDYDGDLVALKRKLTRMMGRVYGDHDVSEEVLAIKMYLKAMVDAGIDYWGPIWEGMIEVEDDYTFISACRSLADRMWT